MNEILLNRLLRHFKEPNVSYNELQRQQAQFVYDNIRNVAGDDLKTVFAILEQLEVELNTRKLNNIYQHLKIHRMIVSNRYDFSASHTPMNLTPYDKGWIL